MILQEFLKVIWRDWRTGKKGEVKSKLKVCKLCLQKIKYQKYDGKKKKEKDKIWSLFNLDEFFEEFESHFNYLPKYTATNAPISGYTDSWKEISSNYRESRNWKCADCKVDLSSKRGLLHTHHKNGIESDNSIKNLKALCKICHSKQPQHQHLRVSFKENNIIVQLRKEQNLIN